MYRAATIAASSSDLWMLALSMMSTLFGPGKSFMLSRRPSTNALKSAAVNARSITLSLSTPEREMAGRTEYLL